MASIFAQFTVPWSELLVPESSVESLAMYYWKLIFAWLPYRATSFLLYSVDASSADWKEPSQYRMPVFVTFISNTHVPHGRCRTPSYFLGDSGGGRSAKERERSRRHGLRLAARRGVDSSVESAAATSVG